MSFFGGDSQPYQPSAINTPPALPNPLPSSPQYASRTARPVRAGGGLGGIFGTIMTSASGDTSSVRTGAKSLLGQ